MLSFESIDWRHKDLFVSFARRYGERGTENCFATLYAWAHKFKTCLCQHGDFLFVRAGQRENTVYLFPLGQGDLSQALSLLEDDAKTRGAPFRMRGLTETMVRKVEAACPGRYAFEPRRNEADYIYTVEDLAELRGKKYHGKRNFITRFENTYAGRYAFEPITENNLNDIWDFQDKWCRKNGCDQSQSLQEEATSIAMLLYNLERVGVFGLMLRLDGPVTAFSLAAPSGPETLDILVEKADYDVQGSYPMIAREMVRTYGCGFSFVNREEDMGLEGLRRSKLSYNPVEVCMKYMATVRAPGENAGLPLENTHED